MPLLPLPLVKGAAEFGHTTVVRSLRRSNSCLRISAITHAPRRALLTEVVCGEHAQQDPDAANPSKNITTQCRKSTSNEVKHDCAPVREFTYGYIDLKEARL
jgi:hypothetical protein